MSKTIIITGSTDGIGKLAAIKLAKAGHEVYLHGRSQEKLNKVIAEVKEASKNETVQGFVADLSDLAAVQNMAQTIQATLPKIDILINNAGVFKSAQRLNKNGWDMRMVVNYFAPYLLTNALIPLLHKGTEPLIINLSSAAQARVSDAMFSGQEVGSERDTYAQSKLALTMWSFDLAKKLDGIAVIALNPGSLLNTRMVQEAYGKYWSPADKGAQIIYDLAVSPDYKGITGQYYDNDQGAFGRAHADAYDENAIQQLLKRTEEVVKGG